MAGGGESRRSDYPALYQAGAAAVFGPGTVIGEAATQVVRVLADHLGIAV